MNLGCLGGLCGEQEPWAQGPGARAAMGACLPSCPLGHWQNLEARGCLRAPSHIISTQEYLS